MPGTDGGCGSRFTSAERTRTPPLRSSGVPPTSRPARRAQWDGAVPPALGGRAGRGSRSGAEGSGHRPVGPAQRPGRPGRPTGSADRVGRIHRELTWPRTESPYGLRERKASAMSTPSTPVVERSDALHRYEVRVDGELAGFTEYLDHDGQRVFYHTLVEDAFAGRGLAGQLVRAALTDVRAAGKRIVPVCPYVAKFLVKHEEFSDIADEVTPEVKGWLRSQLG
ncbi:hypothetical protein GCM10010502_46360 [Kitasatospora aureofaciens]|uniref:N-acetyltransferase domain-containing protein n=2 Tax=Kitasatospora aureofaciens TaxID=1894 RepID=A0A8H9HU53_KITAU|nr:hypothetical protein GCM10010502_46360 [Kitasatospora aureofaciens]